MKKVIGLKFLYKSKLEGWKNRCKNLHWVVPNKDIHEYLDEFLEILDDYQDAPAEDIMGLLGRSKDKNRIWVWFSKITYKNT